MSSPQTTSDFIATLGVNVHVEYTDGKYASSSNVISDLGYLGVDHVRDAVLSPYNQGQSNYDALASAGIKFDMFLQGRSLGTSLQLVDSFLSRHPGSVDLIEGPNEVNNFPINYNGLTGNAAATGYQAALYAAVRSDASLAGVPVADLTSYPILTGPSDEANFHFYPHNGSEPQSTEGSTLAAVAAADPGKTMVMTEGGYNTLLTDTSFGGVDELTQAKLTLNLFCDDAKAGVAQTYVYQLLDAYADPAGTNSDDHFGLFNLDNTPKLAATALHNFTGILETGSASAVGATPLAFEMNGLAASDEMTLTKSANVHDLVLWDEPAIWSASAKSEIAAPTTPVSLHFDDGANVLVFDPLSGTSPVATYTDAHDVTVNVVDHPLIVEVTSPVEISATPLAAAPPTTVMGTGGADAINAAATGSVIFGYEGADSLTGGSGADVLFGNQGADTLSGGAGGDSLFGGKDNDLLFGDGGNDQVFGNLGDDVLHGGSGADSLWGGQGNDVIFGDDGDDWISGDRGDDTLTGGAGNDTFVFAPGSGHDLVTDFTKGQDRLDISGYVASGAHVTLSDYAGGVEVSFGTGDVVDLSGVHAADLTISGGWIL